jgi:translation initiation factor 2 beta subunit (eIF-2beta)/eIF-5
MSQLNIAGLTPVVDPCYRYQMPRLEVKYEGGNSKTIITNLSAVSKALDREVAEILKYFSYELGTRAYHDGQNSIVKGMCTRTEFQHLLSRYIEHFVLCYRCRLPETYYAIRSVNATVNCMACGHRRTLSKAHKLSKFISKSHQLISTKPSRDSLKPKSNPIKLKNNHNHQKSVESMTTESDEANHIHNYVIIDDDTDAEYAGK